MLLTAGVAALILGVSSIPAAGWLSPSTMGFAAAGMLILVLFVARESRARAPLIPVTVLADRGIVSANLAMAVQSMTALGWFYLLTRYLQEGLGHDPFTAGILLLPQTLASLAAAPMSRVRARD